MSNLSGIDFVALQAHIGDQAIDLELAMINCDLTTIVSIKDYDTTGYMLQSNCDAICNQFIDRNIDQLQLSQFTDTIKIMGKKFVLQLKKAMVNKQIKLVGQYYLQLERFDEYISDQYLIIEWLTKQHANDEFIDRLIWDHQYNRIENNQYFTENKSS